MTSKLIDKTTKVFLSAHKVMPKATCRKKHDEQGVCGHSCEIFLQQRMEKKMLGPSCVLRLVKAHGTFHLVLMLGGQPGQKHPRAFGTWQLSVDHREIRPKAKGSSKEQVSSQ